MDYVVKKNKLSFGFFKKSKKVDKVLNLAKAKVNEPCLIQRIDSDDIDMIEFLFTLGCYEGETVTIISKLAENYVISVKDARYSIDQDLAEAIII